MTRNLIALGLAVLMLTACATPQQQCIGRTTGEYRAVMGLLAEVEGNLARGYAWGEREVTRSRFSICQRVVRRPDGTAAISEYSCWRDVVDTVRYRVPIDPAAETRKRDGLKARATALKGPAESAVAACRAAYPDKG